MRLLKSISNKEKIYVLCFIKKMFKIGAYITSITPGGYIRGFTVQLNLDKLDFDIMDTSISGTGEASL